jgi:hypothetical protein
MICETWCPPLSRRASVYAVGVSLLCGRVCVCLARDGYGVVLRVAEEVAKADSVGAADLLQRVKSGDHVVCFELRQQRSGEARLRCEATKGKILLRAERAQFQAY